MDIVFYAPDGNRIGRKSPRPYLRRENEMGKFPIWCACRYYDATSKIFIYWFRIFGYGLCIGLNQTADFNERMNIKKPLRIGNLAFEVLKP